MKAIVKQTVKIVSEYNGNTGHQNMGIFKRMINRIAASNKPEYKYKNFHIFVDVPFVPNYGTTLQVTSNGDFLPVKEVLWSVNEPDVLEILTYVPFFPAKIESLLADGWIMDDPENNADTGETI